MEFMQHHIMPSFAKITQYAIKFFNSEVKSTCISSLLLKFKPTIDYYSFFYKDFAYSSNKLLD